MVETVSQLNAILRERIQQMGMHVDCLADGAVNAEIVVIAEAPGNRERELGVPLIGGSGRYLWDTLARFGIRRQHCYLTNVVKRQLVSELADDKKVIGKPELTHWKGLLEWELSQLPKAKYFLLLGNVALEALTGHTGIEKWRGTVLPFEGKYFICAYNPANLIRTPNLQPIFTLDCSKLDMCMRGKWQEHHIHTIINPSPQEAIQWCDKMISEDAPVSFDLEVKDNETACIGLANSAHVGMCINFRSAKDNRYSVGEETRVRVAIQRVLRNRSTRLVAQNGAFDCAWLWYKDRIRTQPLWLDTLLAHHAIYPTWPHNLGFLTAQYTTHPFYKDEKTTWQEGGDINAFWEYNVKDCCITWEVARKLELELKQSGMDKLFFNHVMKLQPWLINSTVLGNKVDLAMKSLLEQQYGESIKQLEAQFVVEARLALRDVGQNVPDDWTINPHSPSQVSELLFRQLRVVGKSVSTDKANLASIVANPRTRDSARQVVVTLQRLRGEHKLYSTYITSTTDEDGRMRSDYKQFGTQFVPGRLSSSHTLWGSGMNLQNQPERLRGMFIADRMVFND